MLQTRQPFPVKQLLLAILLVGSLDIISAFIDVWIANRTMPDKVLKYIASAVFGKEALAGGISMTIMGLVFHFIIAGSFTVLFYFLYPTLLRWIRNKIFMAFLYALFMWIVMTFIVLPLTPLNRGSVVPLKTIKAVLSLTVAIGLPLSFMMGRFIPFRANLKMENDI